MVVNSINCPFSRTSTQASIRPARPPSLPARPYAVNNAVTATTPAAARKAAQPSQDCPATLPAAFERSAAAVCIPAALPLVTLALICVPEGYEVDGTRSCETEGMAVPTSLFLHQSPSTLLKQ